MSSYLAQYYDPGITTGTEKPRDFEKQEQVRLYRLMSVATLAGAIPRRMGSDFTPAELSLDKKKCRRISHVASQLIIAWGGTIKAPLDVGQEAAQVRWDLWWADHEVWLNNRIRYIATWSQVNGADEHWAKMALTRFNNEHKWIGYALRGQS